MEIKFHLFSASSKEEELFEPVSVSLMSSAAESWKFILFTPKKATKDAKTSVVLLAVNYNERATNDERAPNSKKKLSRAAAKLCWALIYVSTLFQQ